jgi:flagellin
MALIINTNVASLIAQQNLSRSSSLLNISIQRLSSGLRINTAADDAAGLARADQLRSQSKMIGVAMRNANDGISAMEISDKTAEQITNVLTRMSELAASAAQGTLDTNTRNYYKDEYDKLVDEIERIAQTTEFGGIKLLNGSVSSITMFIGFKSSSDNQLSISLVRLDVASVAGFGLDLSAGILTDVSGALLAIAALSTALTTVNDARAIYGASSNRLSITLANLMVTQTNFMAAESRVRDADFALETALFTRNQIMVQAGTSILAQANTLPQNALTLLR